VLRPAVALSLLAAVLLGIWAVAKLNDRTRLFRVVPLADASPEVLTHSAREVLETLGYPDPPAGRAAGYARDARVLQSITPSSPSGGSPPGRPAITS